MTEESKTPSVTLSPIAKLRAMNSAVPMSPGTPYTVHSVFFNSVSIIDDDGEMHEAPNVVAILADGTSIRSASSGIVGGFKQIVAAFDADAFEPNIVTEPGMALLFFYNSQFGGY